MISLKFLDKFQPLLWGVRHEENSWTTIHPEGKVRLKVKIKDDQFTLSCTTENEIKEQLKTNDARKVRQWLSKQFQQFAVPTTMRWISSKKDYLFFPQTGE